MKKLLALAGILSLALAGPTQASEAPFGSIIGIIGISNGALIFSTTSPRSSAAPACQGPGLAQRWAIDASTVAGQAAASTLLTAYALKKRVTVVGTGSCSIWGDTETVNFFGVED